MKPSASTRSSARARPRIVRRRAAESTPQSSEKPGAEARSAPAGKISITVDATVLREVRRLTRKTGQSLSSHITEALARDLRRRNLQQIIEQYEAEAGTITEDELAEIRAEWQA